MSIASVSFATNGGAASNITDGATTFVPAGATIVVALQSSTGISRWRFAADAPVSGADPQGSLSAFDYRAEAGGVFSTTISLPRIPTTIAFVSEAMDANKNPVKTVLRISSFQGAGASSQYQRAAVVNTANVNTAAMNVVIDGQTLVAGERVLLVAQTSGGQNGLYDVGTVAANLAALTRVATLADGEVTNSPVIVEIEKGTTFGGSTWKSTNTGSLTVGTTALTFYPRVHRGTANLASNTVNVTSLWAATGSTAMLTSTNIATTLFGTPTAGAGSGFMVITGAAAGGVGAIAYAVINWG